MARRPATPKVVSEKTLADVVACEENGNHRVQPRVWPPPRVGNQGGDPYLALQCVLCNAHLIVMAAHATNPEMGIDVVLPSPEKRKTA